MSTSGAAHLILAGTTKAATTTLFAWLGAHPAVAPARIKETRYFLDADYPLEPAVPHARGPKAYAALFPVRAPGALRLEATPDYLHSPGTAARLRAELPDARLVFALRDPLARLVSWYRFARSEARLAQEESFEAWVRRQQRCPGGAQHDRALEQGLYARALARYVECFPRAQLHVLFQEELELRPREVLGALCAFAGLEASVYDDFEFAVHNATTGQRHPRLAAAYRRAAFHARRWSADAPFLFAPLRLAQRGLRPLFRRLFEVAPEELVLAPELEEELRAYYAADVRALETWLARPVPWPRFAPRTETLSHAG